MKKEWKFGGGINLLLIICNLILLFAFIVVCNKAGYIEKAFVKLGMKEEIVSKDWAAFSWESCLKNLNLDVDVVFLGDSLTCGAKFQDTFRNTEICNLGYSGDSLQGMRARIGMVSAVKPEKIFIMGGINNLAAGEEISEIQSKYEKLLDAVFAECPDAEIYLESLLPVNEEIIKAQVTNKDIMSLNLIIEAIAKQRKCEYIDLFNLYVDDDGQLPEKMTKDGLHLLDFAYSIWANSIEEYISD